MVTKLSVNIRTLLFNCEELAKDEGNYWRLKKFIKSLDKMIEELAEFEDPQTTVNLEDFKQRLKVLKRLTNYVETPKPVGDASSSVNAYSSNSDVLKEMQQMQTGQQYANVRRELLNDSILYRRPTKSTDFEQPKENLTEAVKYYSSAQDRITEHMLSLTRNLKEQTETANRIIKQDTQVVTSSTGMADKNILSLNAEGEKLAAHSRNAWRCWLWLMISFVISTFVGMVLFMKIVKKKA